MANPNISKVRGHESSGCRYENFKGKVAILSVEAVPGGGSNSPCNPQKITWSFTFTEDSPIDKKTILSEVTVGTGYNPGSKWVNRNEIFVGKIFGATFSKIKTGACSPRHILLEDVNYKDLLMDGGRYCFSLLADDSKIKN